MLNAAIMNWTYQVLEETNKAGLSALLLAVHTHQPEVGLSYADWSQSQNICRSSHHKRQRS